MALQGSLRLATTRLIKSPGTLVVILACLILGPSLRLFIQYAPIQSAEPGLSQAWLHLAAILGASGGVWAMSRSKTALRRMSPMDQTLGYVLAIALASALPAALTLGSLKLAGFITAPHFLLVIPVKCAVWATLAHQITPNRAPITVAALWIAAYLIPQILPSPFSEIIGLPFDPHLLTQGLTTAGLLALALALTPKTRPSL